MRATRPDVRLVPVTGRCPAEQVVGVHEVAATAAYAHIFAAPFPREEALTRWSGHTGRMVLAMRGDEALGFVAWSPEGTLEALYVLPNEAGCGLGTALLDGVTELLYCRTT